METIGSAERETDKEKMREGFLAMTDGKYSQLLFNKFGKDRVLKELEEYFSLTMFKRFGGGIGLTRLERAMELEGMFEEPAQYHSKHYIAQPQLQV